MTKKYKHLLSAAHCALDGVKFFNKCMSEKHGVHEKCNNRTCECMVTREGGERKVHLHITSALQADDIFQHAAVAAIFVDL